MEIVERNEERVKVHYIGYDSSYDEWKEAGELEVYDGGFQLESYVPFSLYTELRYQIKRALNSGSRRDPAVRIELAFDRVLFDGGLAKHGYMKKSVVAFLLIPLWLLALAGRSPLPSCLLCAVVEKYSSKMHSNHLAI